MEADIMEPTTSLVSALVTYGGLGILAAVLLIAVLYLWRHQLDLQKQLLAAGAQRVDDAVKAVQALERNTVILSQLTDVEKQRSEEIKHSSERLREEIAQNARKLEDIQRELNACVDTIRDRPRR